MEKKNIDWENIGFGYIPTDKRFVAIIKMEHGMKVVSQKILTSS